MFWEILGIEPTRDKKEITRAYREKLADTNPEDKPEEFKELRNAYEEALKYADETSGLMTEKKPVDHWRDKLEELYADFPRRNSVEEWRKLFSDDVCQALDSRMAVEDCLLNFLMEKYFITHDVWVLMDREFSFRDRTEELYGRYPKDFIDYIVINGITYNDTLPMNMFVPGKDGDMCQKYLGCYLAIRRKDDESAKEIIDEMLSLPEQHPYGTALALSYKIHFEDENVLNELRELYQQFSDDIYIGSMLISECMGKQDYEEAEQVCTHLLGLYPEHANLKWMYANILADTNRHEEGIRQLNELMRAAGGDSQQIYNLDQTRKKWNENVIEQKIRWLEVHPDDEEAKSDLAWCYLENNINDKAIELANSIDPEKSDKFNYYNLMSNIAFITEDYDKVQSNLDNLIEVIKELPEDSEENIKRKKRLGEMYGRKGYYYYHVKKLDEAMAAYQEALANASDKSDILTQMSQITLAEKNYEKSAEYANLLIRERPDAYHGYLLLAYALFYQRLDREAYDAINKSLDLCKTDLSVYILKIRILIRNGAYEDAENELKFLLESGLENDPAVLYCQGLLLEGSKKKMDEALKKYEKSVEEMGERVKDYNFSDDLYYRMLCIRGDSLNGNKEEDRNIMMELADKGLECNSSNRALMDYKAWLLVKAEKYDEALKMYKELAENPRHPASVDSQIGFIYYQDLKHHCRDSLQWYLKSLEKNGDYSGHFYAGMCHMYLNELEEAEEHFLILQSHEPDTLDSYFRLSYVYAMRNELDKALENINRTIEIVKDRKNDQSRYYLHKVQIFRRMGRPEEAVEVVREIMGKYNYAGNKLIFDIYAQFGMDAEMRQHLSVWKKQRPLENSFYRAVITKDILDNSIFKAKFDRANFNALLDEYDAMEADRMLAAEDRRYRGEAIVLQKWLKKEEQKQNGDYSRVAGNLAFAYFHLGNKEKQAEYAEKALKVIEERLAETRTDELLYLTRKVRMLALLDRGAEASLLMMGLKDHRLCENCPYGSCKDLDIFMMDLEEITGFNERAYKRAVEGHEKWPDEEDFVIGMNILKKKVR